MMTIVESENKEKRLELAGLDKRASASLFWPLTTLIWCVWLTACGTATEPVLDPARPDAAIDVGPLDAPDVLGSDADDADSDASEEALSSRTVMVEVTLDGLPTAGIVLAQGGQPARQITDEAGLAIFTLDLTVDGEHVLIASHPEARMKGAQIFPGSTETQYTIALERFDTSDNLDYDFLDPGEPDRRLTTDQCGHCHPSINDDWYDSVHRRATMNPTLQDLYAGVVSSATNPNECADYGGQWRMGLQPGTGEPIERCYAGDGVLPSLNPGCDTDGSCDGKGTEFGDCANCHAPGIDGALGQRDLLDATGFAYDYGVHCDVCHKVESLDLDSDVPGVGGVLGILRPSEESFSVALGDWLPLSFGAGDDVVNIKMGLVTREHFHQSQFCAGCHQQDQAVLVPGAEIDLKRWPSGRLPIHSTWAEWEAGPMNPAAPCQSCHMPPNPAAENHGDLQRLTQNAIGITGGWRRSQGATRHHSWVGPRKPESRMLELAAGLFIKNTVKDGELVAQVTVKNIGPGHAIPTGEPMRSMVLRVDARCGDVALPAIGGDAIPDFGGHLGMKSAEEDWSVWPGAKVGQLVRVITLTGEHHDYPGFGPFGDGTFDALEKGMGVEEIAGFSEIIAVNGDQVTFDGPLPEGDIAYLGEADTGVDSEATSPALAGAPGFAFARVLVGADGQRMVPHFLAVDVASDNRLLPQEAWTSTHRFEASCATPVVEASLVHRAYPLQLARERGWPLQDTLMVEARR